MTDLRETSPVLSFQPVNEGGALQRLGRSLSAIAGALIGLFMVLLIFGLWRPKTFITPSNLSSILLHHYQFIVPAIGMTFVIITGGIDLSVSSTMALSSVACAMAAKGFSVPNFDWGQDLTIAGGVALFVGICTGGQLLQRGWTHLKAAGITVGAALLAGAASGWGWKMLSGHDIVGVSAPAALAIGIAIGGIVGVVNGALVTTLTLPPFIVTLGTLEGVRGLTVFMTGASPVSGLPHGLLDELHYSKWLGLPPNVWISLALVVIAVPVLHFSVFGRYTYAIGSNERTARLCGVHVERWKCACYIICGLSAGVAGVMMTSELSSGQPTAFVSYELTVIAAVVIGGTSLFGGEGTIVGSVIGVLMIGALYNGCIIVDINPDLQRVFIGGMIILAAAIDRFRHLLR